MRQNNFFMKNFYLFCLFYQKKPGHNSAETILLKFGGLNEVFLFFLLIFSLKMAGHDSAETTFLKYRGWHDLRTDMTSENTVITFRKKEMEKKSKFTILQLFSISLVFNNYNLYDRSSLLSIMKNKWSFT